MADRAVLSDPQHAAGDAAGQQYLTFILDREQYALDILQVQEIRGWEEVTRVPNSPVYLRGVVNLRGTIVPVIDLRLRFGLPEQAYCKETVVIMVRGLDDSGTERSLGLVVDAVSDVIVALREQIATMPEFAAEVPTDCLVGLLNQGGQMVMVLDTPSLFEFGAE